MSKPRIPVPPPAAADRDRPPADFTPVAVRHRHDGWTPEKQVELIEALAESGCVDEACRRVGMSSHSAYALRRRVDAQSFRVAWDAALDYAIRRLSDAAFSRALKGVARPVFFQGEQIGERRYYDERLTMFMLRYRDPVRYGAWLDRAMATRHIDGAAITLSDALNHVADDAWAASTGRPVDGFTGREGCGVKHELVDDVKPPPAPPPPPPSPRATPAETNAAITSALDTLARGYVPKRDGREPGGETGEGEP